MKELKPNLSARLAEDVYALTKEKNLKDAYTRLNHVYGDIFVFGNQQLLKGKTGGPGVIKSKTAFGFTLIGKGPLKGQAIMLFRGTQYLADWLTNANIGTSRSSYSQPVHDGFNQSFKSMLSQLKDFVGSLKDVHTVHCIGHSLGGALATICAEWLRASTKYKPYLYTFGSPRVGLHGFADKCTKQVGTNRIFRAYHKTDIVPCIPFWPFIHTPNAGQDYYLPSPGSIPMAEYHGMDKYVASVKGKNWSQLTNLRPPKTDSSVEKWLKKGGVVGVTMASLEWLNDALVYVLKKCLKGAVIGLGMTISSSLTLMDQMAYILNKGLDLSKAISQWVVYLIRKIMDFLGLKKVVEKADLTTAFIREIFMRLSRVVNEYCQKALDKVMVKGRGV
ncbi:lipase family protein [Aliikangiella sp. IMCC44359]|uniref:lipase family protein n=1 Tax=Aliikangiella sp. IMCC44359 TaxID=3459125 RepID=UPI00403AB1C6